MESVISIFAHILGYKATLNCVDEHRHVPFDRIVCYLKIVETVLEKFVFVVHVVL